MSAMNLFPRLLGDVGGTNARFAWQASASAPLSHIQVLSCSQYLGIAEAIEAYLTGNGLTSPAAAGIGIANPITGDQVVMTNHHWSFSIEQLQQQLSLNRLQVINDFTALALALPLYPRAAGVELGEAVFTEPGLAPLREGDLKPFAALAGLVLKAKDSDKA